MKFRIAPLVVLSLILLSTVGIMNGLGVVRGDAQSPYSSLSVGDWWKYSFQATSGLNLTGTLTETIQSVETILVSGTATDSYKVGVSGSGTFSSSGVSGTWTATGISYSRKSDLAEIRTNETTVFTAGITYTQIMDSSHSVPVQSYQFPLSVGKSWTVTTTTTTKTTTFTSVNSTLQISTTTTTTSTSYVVMGFSIVNVGAGSFEAYEVKSTDASGSVDDFYSPQVENSLKSSHFDPSGTLTFSLSLSDYSAWPYKSSFTVNSTGKSYDILIRADAALSNIAQNSTAVKFQVSGPDGVSGRGDIFIPKQLNNTTIKVYVDTNLVAATFSQNSTHYEMLVKFGLSTHTVTVLFYSSFNLLSNPVFLAGIGIAAAAAVIVAFFVIRGRKKPSPEVAPAAPTEAPSPPPAPPASPPPTTP